MPALRSLVALALRSLVAPALWCCAVDLPAQGHLEAMRYERSVSTMAGGPGSGGPRCAVLDPLVFAHASPSLKDLRLLTPEGEVPYTITLSETAEMTTEAAPKTRIETIAGGIAFDLTMPPRPYTDVDLDIRQTDFQWTAVVSGANSLDAATRTPLGTFSLFDLTGKHLSRSATLRLQESTFRYLHVEVRGSHIDPSTILGAEVPPSRETQTLYTVVARTSLLRQQGKATTAQFRVPARVPVERVSIELPRDFAGNFSRRVQIRGQADAPGDPVETLEGSITRVRLGAMQKEELSVAATMGVNLQEDATIQVAVEDGEETPLPIASVRLEMRQREICFDTPSRQATLFYGDPGLAAPRYGVRQTPQEQQHPLSATLGPEMRNAAFREAPSRRSMAGSRVDLNWLFVVIVLAGSGTLTLRALRRRHSSHHG